MHRPHEVIAFWFGPDEIPSQAIQRRWFTRDLELDKDVRRRFGELHHEAATGGLEHWRATAEGELALVVVLDQFSRNLYRDDPRAFALDLRALAVASEILLSDRARELTYHQRWIALLPFQHAEDRATQAEGVAAYAALYDDAQKRDAPDIVMSGLSSALDFARQHAAIIERFGRFPHRNATLGRVSTPEELAFLKQPGSRF